MPRRTPNTPFEASRDDIYEVEAIEAKRRNGGSTERTEYFVRWKGHLPSENTWEPMPHLEGSEKLVKSFRRSGKTLTTPPKPMPLKSVSNVVEQSAVKLKQSETHHSSKHDI